jgi:transcription elongation factor Elf1
MRSFSQEEQRALEETERLGEPFLCPRCGIELDARSVPRPPAVAYVRHRLLLTCSRCGSHAAIDRA